MEEKNLTSSKKESKNKVFRVGLKLFIVCVILNILFFSLFPCLLPTTDNCRTTGEGYGAYYYYIFVLPLTALSLIMIFTGYFTKTYEKAVLYSFLVCVILFSILYIIHTTRRDRRVREEEIIGTQEILIQNTGALELYKEKYGSYPESLEKAIEKDYEIFPKDFYFNPLYYEVSSDGQSYELRSLGPDGEYNTEDDIFSD